MITPIIIIGAARTGTTWLGNLIVNRFGAFAPSHPLHYGIKEPNLYLLQHYFEKSGKEEFLKVFLESDNYQLLKESSSDLIDSEWRDYEDLFMKLMDSQSERNGKSAWVTKLCPEYLYDPVRLKSLKRKFEDRYNNVFFIEIRRDLRESMTSYVNMSGRKVNFRQKSLLRFPFFFLNYCRFTRLYKGVKYINSDLITLGYQDLRTDHEATLDTISDLTGIKKTDPSINLPQNASPARISFSGSQFASFRFLARILYPFFWRLIINIHLNKVRKGIPVLHQRLVMLERDPGALIRTLEASKDTDLIEYVKNRRT